MQRWMTVWWCQSTKGYTPGTKPNHIFPGHLLAKHLDSCRCFYLCPMCKHLKVSIYFCFLLYGREKSSQYLMPVIKHHIANEKKPYPEMFELWYSEQLFKASQSKNTNQIPADKGGGIITDSVLLTLLTPLRSHTDFAQRFPHPHVEVSLLPFLHHNQFLSD